MRSTRFRLRAALATVTLVTVATASSIAVAEAASGPSRGVNEFGMTHAFYKGKAFDFTYTKGFFCDTAVKAASATKCEVGAASVHAPAKQHDPLYITVPLGFTPKTSMDCPNGLVCVDHPATADLTRLEPALKALYPKLTDAQLTAALKNIAVPGHDHFIGDGNAGKAEWWDVRVIAVTNPSTYASIVKHRSLAYITALLAAKNANVLGPIPSNIWLYFGVSA
jgi:hypothetical protein